MNEAKTIDLKQKFFVAKGKKYFLSDKISIKRYREYEKIVPRLTFGMGFDELFKAFQKLWKAMEDGRKNDQVVILHNIMNGIADYNNAERIMPALEICALVILEEGEDGGSYDRQLQIEKIKNWEEEGYNITDFFPLAVSSINGFNATFTAYIQSQAESLTKKLNLDEKNT